LLNKVSEDS